MHASKNIWQVKDLRTQMFLKKYGNIKPHDRLNCLKKLDSNLIPPCKEVLDNSSGSFSK